MRKIILSAAVIILTIAILMMSAGCSVEKYSVDYCGQKEMYSNAEDSYRAGKRVTLCYTHWATEISYSFFLDGEEISWDIDRKGNMIVSFRMPNHDVKLECEEEYCWFEG